MQRLVLAVMGATALVLMGCGEVDLEQAGRNAAWAAFEASNPEIAQGIEAAQTLRQAAATCGWEDVNAAGLARSAVAGVEDPAVRAAASSLVEDLIVNDAPRDVATGATSASDCSPETRRALEEQIAAIAQGGGEAEGH